MGGVHRDGEQLPRETHGTVDPLLSRERCLRQQRAPALGRPVANRSHATPVNPRDLWQGSSGFGRRGPGARRAAAGPHEMWETGRSSEAPRQTDLRPEARPDGAPAVG